MCRCYVTAPSASLATGRHPIRELDVGRGPSRDDGWGFKAIRSSRIDSRRRKQSSNTGPRSRNRSTRRYFCLRSSRRGPLVFSSHPTLKQTLGNEARRLQPAKKSFVFFSLKQQVTFQCERPQISFAAIRFSGFPTRNVAFFLS